MMGVGKLMATIMAIFYRLEIQSAVDRRLEPHQLVCQMLTAKKRRDKSDTL